jgi:isoaspartyl peptidase/L-asparaginase-like protein (Ntn-hydrolase superfamily)
LDDSGTLAAGSSTGGVFGKMPGRVGDSPICGAGTYASRAVAVVGTGLGELFIETLACARVARLVEDGLHPQEACERVVAYVQDKRSAEAGLLAIDAEGRMGAAYRAASWPVAGHDGPVTATLVEI